MTNAALYFVAPEYDTARKDLKGRHAATEGFFKGFVEHAVVDRFFCFTRDKDQARVFKERVRKWGRSEPIHFLPMSHPPALREAGCLFFPMPVMEPDAWRRRPSGEHSYSFCGVTHTTASHAVMSAFADLPVLPVHEWDAIICPSQSVRKSAELLIEARLEFLQSRMGGHRPPLPQLPVIPLGVDCRATQFREDARRTWRQKLGIAPEDIVLLFVGRLSFHGKAHPLPMYRAAELAQAKTGARLHLIQAGWFGNQAIEKAFRDGLQEFCPSISAHFVDGTDPQIRQEIWSAADIFMSLSDNIQETFGLTPIEAMAASLPIIATDWDGYRESITHGEQGFLVPTLMPPAPYGEDLAAAYAADSISYDHYIGYSCQFVAVDIPATRDALVTLIEKPELRRAMGEAGCIRASAYDWSVIIPAYQELWAELAARRGAAVIAERPNTYRPIQPSRPDPFHMFGHYPTQLVLPDTIFALESDSPDLDKMTASALVSYGGRAQPDRGIINLLLERLARGPAAAQMLVDQLRVEQQAAGYRALAWLAKLGILRWERPF